MAAIKFFAAVSPPCRATGWRAYVIEPAGYGEELGTARSRPHGTRDHELQRLRRRWGRRMRPGCHTVEPGIYSRGSGAMRIEGRVLIPLRMRGCCRARQGRSGNPKRMTTRHAPGGARLLRKTELEREKSETKGQGAHPNRPHRPRRAMNVGTSYNKLVNLLMASNDLNRSTCATADRRIVLYKRGCPSRR